MARMGGGCEWYQSVGLYIVNISADYNFFKDPGHLAANNYMGRH
jgi:hypothetical protein